MKEENGSELLITLVPVWGAGISTKFKAGENDIQ